MAKYYIRQPAYVGGGITARYFPAGVITIGDDEQPSRTWLPLDEPAQTALERLGVKREIGSVEEPVAPPEAPDTMAGQQLRRPKRAADRS